MSEETVLRDAQRIYQFTDLLKVESPGHCGRAGSRPIWQAQREPKYLYWLGYLSWAFDIALQHYQELKMVTSLGTGLSEHFSFYLQITIRVMDIRDRQ